MTHVERMTVKNLAYCLRGQLADVFTPTDRADLAAYARLQLASIGVEADHILRRDGTVGLLKKRNLGGRMHVVR